MMNSENPSILVTGATGYFGNGFVQTVLEQNISSRVCIFSRDEFKQAQMRERFGNDGRLRWFVGDVRDRERLRRAMDGVNLVVHAAALKRVEVGEVNPAEMVKTNINGAMNVIEAAIDAKVSQVIALSTDKACEPMNTYGASKLVAEKLFLSAHENRGARGPSFTVCRYGNVAGSTGSVIPTWRQRMGDGKEIRVTDGQCTRFWMTLDEAVKFVIDAIGLHPFENQLRIPNLPAYRLADLVDALGIEKHTVIGLGDGEKRHESMVPGISSDMAYLMSVAELRRELQYV